MSPLLVTLRSEEIKEMYANGRVRLHKLRELDEELPGLGGCRIPDEYKPLLCEEAERKNYPDLFEEVPEEDRGWYIRPPHWELKVSAQQKLHELYHSRYVRGHWSLHDALQMDVFANTHALTEYLQGRFALINRGGFVIRDQIGNVRELKISFEIV